MKWTLLSGLKGSNATTTKNVKKRIMLESSRKLTNGVLAIYNIGILSRTQYYLEIVLHKVHTDISTWPTKDYKSSITLLQGNQLLPLVNKHDYRVEIMFKNNVR